MADVTPEIQAIIDRQEASLQRIAMRIMEIPKDRRDEACDAARRSFEAAFANYQCDPERVRNYIGVNMERLRTLLIEMEVGGGHGHA
jgi:hypothetical protein